MDYDCDAWVIEQYETFIADAEFNAWWDEAVECGDAALVIGDDGHIIDVVEV